MPTIRRLYLYTLTLVSLEVWLWGAIGLGRSFFAGGIGGEATRLAEALALVLVGIPVFWLHWKLVQRQAARDPLERSARLRAIFLYGTLAATLVPGVQNLLSMVNRLAASSLGVAPWQAMLGGNQSLSDNLVAVLLNGLLAAYFYWVLRGDWLVTPTGDDYAETRRLYRYAWLTYGLLMVIFGAQQMIKFSLLNIEATGSGIRVLLINGLSLLLVGTPLWVFSGERVRRSLVEPAERTSFTRLVVLYTIVFISAAGVLLSTGLLLEVLLRLGLGERLSLEEALGQLANPLSLAIPLGAVWAYYGRNLGVEMRSGLEGLHQAGMRRLYAYGFSLLGLGGTFIGLQVLLDFVLDLTLPQGQAWGAGLRRNLSTSLATILVSLPVWAVNWRRMTFEAAQDGEAGDHARRSLVRKAYLYLLLFVGVIGVMVLSVALLALFLRTALGDPPGRLLLESSRSFKALLLFGWLAAYHGQALRADARLAERSLARRHAQYPVLVLAPNEPGFAESLLHALQREAPGLPVAVHPYSLGAPDETLSAARAVILPGELAARPSEALRLWLQGYSGTRLLVPTPVKDWQWLASTGSLPELARQAARAVRQIAEGQMIPQTRQAPAWQIAACILAGLFVAEILMGLIGLFLSLIVD